MMMSANFTSVLPVDTSTKHHIAIAMTAGMGYKGILNGKKEIFFLR